MFLGAGASCNADYPSTPNLLNEIGKEMKRADIATRDDWKSFNAFRKNAKGTLKAILNSPNPELVLTVPDLLEATLSEAEEREWKQLKEVLESGKVNPKSIKRKNLKNAIRNKLSQGHRVKLAFQRIIDHFFSMRHAKDTDPSMKTKRDYLHRALTPLKNGDVVITTNWDTLAERVLMEARKWLPSDGYGFRVNLESESEWNTKSLPGNLQKPSMVKVLKLHGSLGWFSRHAGQDVYLRHANYLQYMILPGARAAFRDQNEPPSGSGPPENPLLIFPSYLKKFEHPVFQSIWDQAAIALNQADQVMFVGYSLPPADIAVRILINPLKRRRDHKGIKIRVVNPNEGSLERYKNFLGTGIEVIQKGAKEYFCQKTDFIILLFFPSVMVC